MKNVLLTGGAGYIGSHIVVALQEKGYIPIIFDNLSNSSGSVVSSIEKISSIKPKFIKGDIRDTNILSKVLKDEKIDLVIHLAGLKSIGESVSDPLIYFDNNLSGTISLLKAMNLNGVKRLIFSSSATVYGQPDSLPLTESSPTKEPTNPYGRTKLFVEKILEDLCKSDGNWSVVCLRYFNPVGAHPSSLIGETPSGIPNNLMPYISKVATGDLPFLKVFGNDYSTPDGTGVRDFIHVMDLAEGHIAAIPFLEKQTGWTAVNLGCGRGYSVLQLLNEFSSVIGKEIPFKFEARRPGDVGECWASPNKALQLFNWKAKRNLRDMCVDSWNYERSRSMGIKNEHL